MCVVHVLNNDDYSRTSIIRNLDHPACLAILIQKMSVSFKCACCITPVTMETGLLIFRVALLFIH